MSQCEHPQKRDSAHPGMDGNTAERASKELHVTSELSANARQGKCDLLLGCVGLLEFFVGFRLSIVVNEMFDPINVHHPSCNRI